MSPAKLPSSVPRDLRVDFIRGLMLMIIFIDHSALWPMPGFRWISDFTLHRFSFLDASDVFVFLSGYAAGIVYSRRFSIGGFSACLRAAGWRSLQLYAAEIGLFVVCLAVMSFPMLARAGLPAALSRPYHEIPLQTAIQVLTMRNQPILLGLLPLYIFFTALTPLATLLASTRPRLLAGLMIGSYITVHAALLLRLGVIDSWYFNPFAWELNFFCAFLLGRRTVQNPNWWADLGAHRWLTPAAVAGLCLILLIRIAPTWPVANLLHTHVLSDIVPRTIPFADKQSLGPLRLVNLALWVILIAAVNPGVKFLRRPLAGTLIICGQNSLAVYWVGTVLNYLGFVFVISPHSSRVLEFFWLLSGCLVQYGTALAWKRLQDSKREAKGVWLEPNNGRPCGQPEPYS